MAVFLLLFKRSRRAILSRAMAFSTHRVGCEFVWMLYPSVILLAIVATANNFFLNTTKPRDWMVWKREERWLIRSGRCGRGREVGM